MNTEKQPSLDVGTLPRDREGREILKSKRISDISLAFCILFLTLPLTFIALLSIKVTHILRGNRGAKLFYSEVRMSQGKLFLMYKFNIFKPEKISEARMTGTFIHTKDFEKKGGVTKVGWVLKQIYMDELPQFYNVIKGDMSIVGPRPVNSEVYRNLMDAGVYAKNEVVAGITGNFQSFKDTRGKGAAEMDQEYVDFYKSHSGYAVWKNDVQIMLRTIKVILRAKGI